jgi:Cu-processing system permease protein
MTRILTIARIVWLEMIRRKDLYVLLILLAALLMVLISVNVYGLGSVARYVKDIGLLLTWLCAWIFAIGSIGRQLPQEEAKGTIYSLLAKPVTRMELLLGKWLGAWSMAIVATAVFYLLVLGVTWLRGGSFVMDSLAQAFLLHAMNLGMVTALAWLFPRAPRTEPPLR